MLKALSLLILAIFCQTAHTAEVKHFIDDFDSVAVYQGATLDRSLAGFAPSEIKDGTVTLVTASGSDPATISMNFTGDAVYVYVAYPSGRPAVVPSAFLIQIDGVASGGWTRGNFSDPLTGFLAYENTTLSNSTHNVVIEVRPGWELYFDVVVYTSFVPDSTSSSSPAAMSAPTEKKHFIDDFDSVAVYQGATLNRSLAGFAPSEIKDGTVTLVTPSGSDPATISMNFTGDAVYVYTAYPTGRPALVPSAFLIQIDGVASGGWARGNFSDPLWGFLAYENTTLSNSAHNVVIEVRPGWELYFDFVVYTSPVPTSSSASSSASSQATSNQPVAPSTTKESTVSSQATSNQPMAPSTTKESTASSQATSNQPMAPSTTKESTASSQATSNQPGAQSITKESSSVSAQSASNQPVVPSMTTEFSSASARATSNQPVAQSMTQESSSVSAQSASNQPVAPSVTKESISVSAQSASSQPVAPSVTKESTASSQAVSNQAASNQAVSNQPVAPSMTKKSSSVSAQAASNQVDLNQAASTQPAAPSMTIDYVVYTFVPDSGSAFSSQSASAHAASNQPMTPCTTKKNKVFIGAMAGGIIGGTIGGISSLVLLLVLFFLRRRAMGKSRRRAISRRNLPFIDEHDDKRKSVWKDSDIHDSPAVGDEDLLVAAEVRRLIAALQRLETGMTEAHDGGPVIFQRPPAYGGRVGAVN